MAAVELDDLAAVVVAARPSLVGAFIYYRQKGFIYSKG